MKHTLTLLTVLLLAPLAALQAAEFHVAPTGSDGSPGTAAEPFATLERARDAIRELKKAGSLTEPVNVIVQGGTYQLTKPLELTKADSGTAAVPVVYRAGRRNRAAGRRRRDTGVAAGHGCGGAGAARSGGAWKSHAGGPEGAGRDRSRRDEGG